MDASRTQAGKSFYLPRLDSLRFFAFLLVYIHNAQVIIPGPIYKAINEYGWIGVDLFFGLSGYLITRLLREEYEKTGAINVRNFYFRRMLRIWPLYFFYILPAFAYSYFFLPWNSNANVSLQLFGLFTFTFNYIYMAAFPYVVTLFIHLWTISYEMQFYLLIPLVLRKILAWPAQKKAALVTGLFLFLEGAKVCLFVSGVDQHLVYYMLPFTRFEGLLGGIAIGLGLLDGLMKKFPNRAFLGAGVLSLMALPFLPNAYEVEPGLMLTYLAAGAGVSLLLLAFVRPTEYYQGGLWANPILGYLGRISYGLYIYHVLAKSVVIDIVLAVMQNVQSQAMANVLVFIPGLMFTIIAASISYWLLEKPFLKGKRQYEYAGIDFTNK